MSYLEEEQLIIGREYDCQTYDGDRIHAIYLGDMEFQDGDHVYDHQTIRYVLREIIR